MLKFNLIKRWTDKFFAVMFFILFHHSFRKFGKRVRIYSPDSIQGEKYISLHDGVVIRNGSWLLALKNDEQNPMLDIGENSYIGRYAHIVSVRSVIVGRNVLIADKVYITDNLHEYQHVHIPIKEQPVIFKNKVKIGDGSWLGENVCVIGASVGKNSVIAANSVVTKDIPDYCVAAGIPAKVIKKFNIIHNEWEQV